CLNGGQCVQSQSCDCSLYQATGHRCQTVPNPGFEREMTCRTWGQHNFETFDGLYFHFPGRCTYTLRCPEGLAWSSVHNDPGCGSATYACQRSVSLFLPWEGEVRLHATNVTYKGQRSAVLQLPHHIHDLQLEQISQYVLVTRRHGFTLAWDGRGGSVYIKLSPEFVGRTCGLCGNFNADVRDDLRTSYGVLTSEIEMFGNSWVETEPHQAPCPMVPSGFSSPCAAVNIPVCVRLQKVEEVCAMLLDPPFQGCHDFVSPLSYMASCSNDLCTGDVMCRVFSEYARACAHADRPLHDWRLHIPQCVFAVYRECISCCPESCSLERTCIDSKLACLDGCYCPDGLIYEDGGCVTTSDCPCEYHGMFYPSGQTLQEEWEKQLCGSLSAGECSVTGDMYFQSFDGRIYTFPATCQYVLAKSRNSGKFTVTVQNAPCGANLDGACIQSVNLVIDEDPRTEITLSHVGDVFMAGQYRISPPYSDDVFQVQELSSMFLQVRTAFGLRLQYNWKEFRLYLQADERWTDDTVGLCGTFNGNIQDDFLSPSGMIESTPQLFGNAWRVSSGCSHIGLSAPQLDPCDAHQQAVTYASGMCDVLNQDLFSACHEYLSPTPFHQQCRSDTCKCGTPCLCSALAHYARHCRRFSVIVDFRSHVADCAVACPASMQYGTCVSSCQRRCSALSVPQHCGEECEEGCVCPQGSFYNHRTLTCVHRSECPCSFLGADYEPGDSPLKHPANVWFLLPRADRLCPAGQLYQNCSEGEDGLLPGRGVACERTCESHLLNLTCSTHEPCVAGCSCPPGLLKHGDECFEPASCPCLWKGKEYYPGDRVSSPCHHCVCQHGTFQCVFRPCPSMCTAYGDRHYRTFDGLLFDYVGACKVYLVKSSADVMLGVVAENVDCFDGGVICRKSLTISIGRSSVAFDDDSGTPNPSSVIDRKQRMLIWPAGHFTVIHFPDDAVTVLWDRKTTVHVQVGPRWQGKLSGLCGNFDLKTVNEMRTPDNIDSPTPQEFGNSWTACVNSPDIRHPCSLSPLREPFAKRRCAVLLGEVFQACHPVVDVTWFYMNCLADTCACSRGGDCECFCTSVAAYAQRCCHQGVPVDWRSPSLCPYDCEFFNKVICCFIDLDTLTICHRFTRNGFSCCISLLAFWMYHCIIVCADTSRVSFEAADRPNYFLHASAGGRVTLAKWQESEAFWDGATFVLHRNTWIPGYDSLESHALPGFFLHATPLRLHLLKYRHGDGFRKATLFRLTDAPPRPQCQWRYDSCVSPCFRTCSDPSAEACVAIPQVEGCLPVCPPHMVLDEVTRRCVHVEDCEYDFTESSCGIIETGFTQGGPTRPLTASPELSGTAGHPSSPPPTAPSAARPEAVEPPSTARATLFWITTSTRPTDSLLPLVTTTATTLPAPISETSSVTGRTTVPSMATSAFTYTTTKPVTEERPPPTTTTTPTPAGLPSTALTSAPPLSTSPPVETGPVSLPASASAKTTESVTPVAPLTASRTTRHVSPATTTQTVRTTEIQYTTTTELTTTTTTAPELRTSTHLHVAPTTTVPSAPTSAAAAWETTTTTTTGADKPEATVSETPAAPTTTTTTTTTSTTAAPPPLEIADTTTPPVSTPSPYTERTSWSAVVPTTQTTRPSEVPGAPTASTARPVTTKPTALPASRTETTTAPLSPTTDTSTRPASTMRTSEPWRPPHQETSSTVTSETVVHAVDSTETTGAPRLPVTTARPVATSAASAAATTSTAQTTTSAGTSAAEVAAATTRALSAPPTPPEPGSPRPRSPQPPPELHQAYILGSLAMIKSSEMNSASLLIVFSSSVSAFSVFHFVSIQPPYAEMVDECTKYICVHNQLVLFNKSQICPFASEPPDCGLLGLAVLVDGDKCCPQWDCPCRCSVFPDLSVITFDGSSVAVYKAASYIVSQLPNETVSVVVQECPADLLWNFTNLCLVALNITHKTNHIIVNRLQRRVRAAPSYGFEIYDTGNMYLIRSPAGLRLQWYHSTGTMVIDTDGSGNKLPTMGLCGFCDGDPTNDLTLPNGTAVGAGEDPALFIDSWQVPNTTSYVSQSRRRELNCSTGDCSVCMAMLQTGHFAPCHAFVPPSTFCEVWVRDAEYVNNQCVALAAYVASCHKFNVCVEWRRPDHCPFACPDALRYQACVSACTSQSCPDHDVDSDPDRCSGLTEGCVCPEGTLLHRPYSALCVSPDKCACTDSSGAPRAHGDVWKASKDACCMYRCDNDTIVPVEYNCSGAAAAAAPACRRAGEVVIGLADDTSCCPQKVCVCNQSLCDLPPPECKYGEKLVSYYRRDSCCPHYVCECDPDLCESDVPSCREDQTRIATRADDGSCCLAHICVCSSSCAETLPLCQDGEVLTVDGNVTDRCCPAYHLCDRGFCSPCVPQGEAAQLDRASLSDPQNQCACKRYKCVREAVCVFGERGVLRPGQTLVEHGDDGLCHSRQCSRSLDPASGFHLLRTASVNCSAHCQPNQIYVPPRDQATCCGVCKNISCLHEHDNGTVARYKPGKSWVSNCVKFDCTDTLSGPTLVSYSFSCPPFNETECVKVGGTVVSYMDGCCRTCKEDGKSCQKVTVRMTIRKNDCRSNRPVNIVSCDGKCPSASIYNYNINTYARFCKCCRETGLQRRSVQLYCSGNATWVSYSIQEPTDCSCQWS
uniref:Otogelin n=1 Tax=Scophthalmus maximus TaxID=52904 RepID=A0A8D3CQY1_SCOMX